ncbi:MAG: hypothetical protein ACQETE_07755 [Bacteroidota bacterium]
MNQVFSIDQREYLLAEKAEDILEHQRQLESLYDQRARLLDRKPTVEQDRITFEEALQLEKQTEAFEHQLKELDARIQKVNRELHALQLQAKKLIPVSGVTIQVTTQEEQSYAIKHISEVGDAGLEDEIQVMPERG